MNAMNGIIALGAKTQGEPVQNIRYASKGFHEVHNYSSELINYVA